ncbi:flavin-dependent monooxygenase [Halomonas sp. McH1-25]|uniref:acyl-CoA dehydrogenase family protein n=1 Tax=unclassified Halomonas TaxID=2609666 RepID=UPI001EF511F5|nr:MULTISPECIES: acyl-CoA dehydrogenase family protein [unclassified Halomonas]MCG7602187.1 flavin-dependent monooxygenase [Halomonas sp. McH1-25]MCP1344673.1 flavin-dependent monooxygenase [Halomonas sp. FL8]MCP1362478.1 flavin-dependent monooxygenase [Halomonas sp. BBD45]MCP1365471.1 flavin-dependent monooxygenase [Halomonas sp. BBD48]
MHSLIDKSLWGGEERFDALLQAIRQRREEFEAQRCISDDIIDEFKAIGVYRAMVPSCYGGDERSPAEFLKMVEAISAADGSAGWVASFGMNPAYLAALPKATTEEIWRDSPDIVFAGGIFPPQTADRVDKGFRISGRWKFASGCMGASLCGVGILPDEEGALPRMAVLPREQVEIDPTWNMMGMVGTGSHDLVIKDAYVPEEWTFVRGGQSNIDSPFFRYPSISFATQVLAVTTLGLAREALDIVRATAAGRKSVTGAPLLGEREYAQIVLAKAEARVRAARAFFFDSTEAVWATILTGEEPSREQINLLRLSSTHLTHECAEAIRNIYQVSGMSGADNNHPLSRIVRDSMLVTQHAFMGEITWKNAGAMFFGHDPLPGYL